MDRDTMEIRVVYAIAEDPETLKAFKRYWRAIYDDVLAIGWVNISDEYIRVLYNWMVTNGYLMEKKIEKSS